MRNSVRKANIAYSLFIVTILVLSLWSSGARAKDLNGGSGTPKDPYQIVTVEQLLAVNTEPNACYILGGDIDLAGHLFTTAVIEEFGGSFDGQGFQICNLTIQGDHYVGLFGLIGPNATVQALGCTDANIVSLGNHAGILAGGNQGNISDCYSTGSVSGDRNSGGLLGTSDGSVTRCFSGGSVNGRVVVGGLTGWNAGKIEQSYSSSEVLGNRLTGGLVGFNTRHVSQSYSTGSVISQGTAGGLVGSTGSKSTISQCYSTAAVYGGENSGGLIGGKHDESTVVQSLWDKETSGQVASAGGVGLSSHEMKQSFWYALNGWANDPAWLIKEGYSAPYLTWERRCGLSQIIEPATIPLEGTGIEAQPYCLEDPSDLLLVSKASLLWDKHVVLIRDIDLRGDPYGTQIVERAEGYPGGTSVLGRFSGVFDGQGYRIINLNIQGSSGLGLFGHITETGVVKNLGIVDANVVGAGSNVGLLAGLNNGTVLACYTSGTATGQEAIGGLVGAHNAGTISQSYSKATVMGDREVGGFIGTIMHGNVKHCYSTGTVSGSESVGGLIGRNYGGSVLQCLWDIETSGQDNRSERWLPPLGDGLPTSYLYEDATYISRGWDFVGETENGTDDFWAKSTLDYPILSWELPPRFQN